MGGLKEIEPLLQGTTDLNTELSLGLLPMVMVKMVTLDRDEHDSRRIPILMNFIKLKIPSNLKSHSERHTSFRIELKYGDFFNWVIHRELKDFINLHTHFKISNLRPNQSGVTLPSFPKTTFPTLSRKSKKGEGEEKQRRKALEIYLLKLVRATMFSHTEGANRLCKFLEISAIAISLGNRGGEQGKQGYLVSLLMLYESRTDCSNRELLLLEHREEKHQV